MRGRGIVTNPAIAFTSYTARMRARIVRIALLIAFSAGIAVWAVSELRRAAREAIPPGFVVGNGRVEATEINISTKSAGRIEEILADEGDFIRAGDPLVRMQTDALDAQRAEAAALLQMSRQAVATARAQVSVRESALAAATAFAAQRRNELALAIRRLDRAESAGAGGATSPQELDDARTQRLVAESALEAAQAQIAAAGATVARLAGVRLRYRRRTALDGVSLEIREGELVGLIGPDGVGKSSLLSLLSGARRMQEGSIEVRRRHAERTPPRARRLAHRLHAAGARAKPLSDAFGR